MRRPFARLSSVVISFCHETELEHHQLTPAAESNHLSAPMACVNDMGPEAEKGPRIVYLGFVEGQLFNPLDDETNAPCPGRGGPGRRWKHSNVQAATVGVWQCACTLLDVAG